MKKSKFLALLTIPAFFALVAACAGGGSSSSSGAALVFSTQPGGSGAIAGVSLPVQPVVTIEDAKDQVVDSATPVTISITPGSGGSGAMILGADSTGSVTVNAVKGVATFSGVAIVPFGSGYTLTAASPGLTSATSDPFDVGQAPVSSMTPVATPSPAAP